jgi:hypothetical protein
MKCEKCKRQGDVKSSFKAREIHSIQRTYYVCRTCGTANRPSVGELTPTSRWGKKALAAAREIRNKMLRSASDIKITVLVWGPGGSGANEAIYQKRKQIRDILRRRNLEAFFSEELPLTDELGNRIPFDVAEVLQSEHCNLVINIADSTQGPFATKGTRKRKNPGACLLWAGSV